MLEAKMVDSTNHENSAPFHFFKMDFDKLPISPISVIVPKGMRAKTFGRPPTPAPKCIAVPEEARQRKRAGI